MGRRQILILAGLLCGSWLAACSEDQIVITADIQRADGKPVFEGEEAATLSLQLRQGDDPPQEFLLNWPTHTLSWTVPVSRSLPLRVGAEYVRQDTRLLGASPEFIASDASNGMRVMLATPAECETLADLQLAVPRLMAGFAEVGSTGVVIGGEPEGENASVEFINLVNLKRLSYVHALDVPLGPTWLVVLDNRYILVVSEEQPTFLYDISVPGIVPTNEDLGSVTVPAQPQKIEFETGIVLELLGNTGTSSHAVRICIPEDIDMGPSE